MNKTDLHVMAVKREVDEGRIIPTKNIGMEIVNLDNFLLSFKNSDNSKDNATINIGELLTSSHD